MNCNQARTMMSAYRELRNEEVETAELDAHLEECADCRAVLASYTQVGEQLREAPAFAPPQDLHAKLMKALADEQLKFLQKSAPGSVPTPEFLKPYLPERARETQRQADIAAFSTAETGPLPHIQTRRKPRKVQVRQFAVLGLAASILMLLMLGGLTSLLMLEHNNPGSIARTSNSVNRPTEVDQKVYATTTLYPNVTSALPAGDSVYYTAYGNGVNSESWMLMQFDRRTQTSKPLLDTPTSDSLILLSVSNSWLVWLQYSRPQYVAPTHLPQDSSFSSPRRSWSLHYLSLLPQPSQSTQAQSTDGKTQQSGSTKTSQSLVNDPDLVDMPATYLLDQGVFDNTTAPSWVSTPVAGSWLIGDSDTLLVTLVDQKGISHLVSYQLGQSGKAAQSQQLASAPAGHVFAWPTADSNGLEMYWADEWVTPDGTLHSNIWQQQTSEQTVRYHGQMEEMDTHTQQLYMSDGLSFQPQVVNDTLFFLSTSEVRVEGQGDVEPNGIPFPTSATDAAVQFTPRTDTAIYPATLDSSVHGTVFMVPLSGTAVGTESTLGTVGQSTGFRAGSTYIIWQDSTGYQMYDVQRQSDVVLGDTLNGASLLVVNGDTALWLSSNATGSSASKLFMRTFTWAS